MNDPFCLDDDGILASFARTGFALDHGYARPDFRDPNENLIEASISSPKQDEARLKSKRKADQLVSQETSSQKRSRSAKATKSSMIPGYFCFELGTNGSSRRREKPTESKREQTKQLRKLGACLRCRLMKKPVCIQNLNDRVAGRLISMQCSGGNPCESCLIISAKNNASRVLGWMTCVRPSLAKLNLFQAST